LTVSLGEKSILNLGYLPEVSDAVNSISDLEGH